MAIGATNQLPFRVGGGPTEVEKVFAFLKNAVGIGGSSPNPLSIEATWRRAIAKGLVCARGADARVVYNAFPQFATDFLAYFERVLQLTPATDETETQRREEATTKWVSSLSARIPEVAAALQEIDPAFTLPDVASDREITSLPGRVFAPFDVGGEAPTYGSGPGFSRLGMYNTYDVVRVQFATTYDGPLTAVDLRKIERAKDLMRSVLPSWNDFWIYVLQPGMAGQAQFLAGATPAGFGAPL